MKAPALARPPKRGRIDALQVLRFLAAGLVVIGHVQHELVDKRGVDGFWSQKIIDWGLGVDIFFVISGFVMYYLMHDRFGSSAAASDFLRRRLIRVVPLYWICTTLVIAIQLREGLFAASPAQVAFSYLFLPGPQCDIYCFPVYSLGWTLDYEMLFYALFTLALLWPKPKGPRLLVGAILGLMLIGQLVPRSWQMLHGWGDPIIGEFLLGVLLARGFVRGWSLPRPAGWALVGGGFALAILCFTAGLYQMMWRLVTGGVPAVMIVAGAVLALEPRRASGWLRFLVLGGDASYALYLSHPFAVKLLAIIETRIGLWHPGFFAVTAVAAAILMAFAVHLLVERPLLALMMRRWSRFGSTGHGDGEPVAPITAPRLTPER